MQNGFIFLQAFQPRKFLLASNWSEEEIITPTHNKGNASGGGPEIPALVSPGCASPKEGIWSFSGTFSISGDHLALLYAHLQKCAGNSERDQQNKVSHVTKDISVFAN
jgi:hypothetical protein